MWKDMKDLPEYLHGPYVELVRLTASVHNTDKISKTCFSKQIEKFT